MRIWPVLLLALLAPIVPARAQNAAIIDVATARPGVTQSALLVTPAGGWDQAVILFVGSGGQANVARHGPNGRGPNTLYRGMDVLVRQGLAALVVDPPSDRATLWEARTTEAHAQDVGRLIAELRRRGARQVWLAGISMGTLSAANAAARLGGARPGPAGPDGIVLLSAIVNASRESSETIRDVALDAITVPVLLVRNPNDNCRSSPPSGADQVRGRLTRAHPVRLLEFSGTARDQSGPCDALSAHGFLGLDEQVLGAVAAWIKSPT